MDRVAVVGELVDEEREVVVACLVYVAVEELV